MSRNSECRSLWCCSYVAQITCVCLCVCLSVCVCACCVCVAVLWVRAALRVVGWSVRLIIMPAMHVKHAAK